MCVYILYIVYELCDNIISLRSTDIMNRRIEREMRTKNLMENALNIIASLYEKQYWNDRHLIASYFEAIAKRLQKEADSGKSLAGKVSDSLK